MTASALQRVINRGSAGSAEVLRCGLCACPVPDQHRHALDSHRGGVMCLCRPCALLFGRDGASQGHYRLIPQRRLRLTGLMPSALGVPVGLAYFVRSSAGEVTAHYPSPLGSTTFVLEACTWQSVAAACPPLATLDRDVEALLVNTVRGADERWIVPIDDCFRLTALIGQEWTGLSGGSRLWPQIEAFFADLKEGTHG
ncbi:MAG TPA: DUF5947 family protein [Trebonia sp.]|nr:DUF5947 family protein [Trebonia sp.]